MGFNLNDLMTSTSKNDMHIKKEDVFQNASFRDIKLNLESNMKLMARNTVKIGYLLKVIRDRSLYTDAGHSTFAECALKEFGLSESSTYRFIRANDEYSVNGNSYEIDDKYISYNSSQLIEMINMPAEQREQITPDMPVKEIRKAKKAAKEVKKSYTDCQAYKARGTCEGCYYESSCECPYDRSEYPVTSPAGIPATDAANETEEYEAEVIEEKSYAVPIEPVPVHDRTAGELPCLSNDAKRYAFIDSYSVWPVWLDIPQTGERYYRYDLPDGTCIVIKDYEYHPDAYNYGKMPLKATIRGWAEYFHLRDGDGLTFKDSKTNRSMLVEHLKSMANKYS